ncbi:cytochrome P450 [Mycena pura]|uniref:Cytochrome P450 n=1 Tax=Mycena pura TaxID=153505 RepID=A0AAD6VLX3_9AGAR|nr:cytochrome P450 [Mycena pura]
MFPSNDIVGAAPAAVVWVALGLETQSERPKFYPRLQPAHHGSSLSRSRKKVYPILCDLKVCLAWWGARGSTGITTALQQTDEAALEKTQPTVGEVVADGVLSIIAGSDTTSVALSSFVFFLLSNPDIYQRVQAEVDAIYPDGESLLDTSKHAELHFLTACLNETLRLSPPVPSNGPRQVPRGEGRLVAGCFIPAEHTQIYIIIPPYAMHRSAAHFNPAPDAFDPDRWLRAGGAAGGRAGASAARPGEVLNPAAFIPFSYGAHNCVGRALAWREMLMLSSTLLRTFEVRFAGGLEAAAAAAGWAERLHDVFVTSVGAPPMV